MLDRRLIVLALLAITATGEVWAADAPPASDGLVRVQTKRTKALELRPGADFRLYDKVMFDATEVAFEKDWRRDYNRTTVGVSGRVSEADVEEVINRAGPVAGEIFAKAFAEGGYKVVTQPGPGVLRLRTAIANISVRAPEMRTSSRSRTYAEDAGQATLIMEASDSVTGEVLGRVAEHGLAGDSVVYMRNSATNRSDFRQLARSWAKKSVNGLRQLKSLSPINATGQKQR
jgi:hypothetical protein